MAAYPWMSPESSSCRMRRAQGVAREAHLLGEVRHADTPIALQDIQDSSIRLVELHNWRI